MTPSIPEDQQVEQVKGESYVLLLRGGRDTILLGVGPFDEEVAAMEFYDTEAGSAYRNPQVVRCMTPERYLEPAQSLRRPTQQKETPS